MRIDTIRRGSVVWYHSAYEPILCVVKEIKGNDLILNTVVHLKINEKDEVININNVDYLLPREKITLYEDRHT